jgi:hypothetical protein
LVVRGSDGNERPMGRPRLLKYLKTLEEIRSRKKPLKQDTTAPNPWDVEKEAGRDAGQIKANASFH